MILYDNESWLKVVFAYRGTVWSKIGGPFVLWSLWVLVCFKALETMEDNLGKSTQWDRILGISMSYLLIFRANQAYNRYDEGQAILCKLFSAFRVIVVSTSLHVNGGAAVPSPVAVRKSSRSPGTEEDSHDALARELRGDVVRLIVAYAVLVRTHTRIAMEGYQLGSISASTKLLIDWDRFRLRQLLKDDEFILIDKSLGIIETDVHINGAPLEMFVELFEDSDVTDFGRVPDHWPENFEVTTQKATRPNTVVAFWIRELLVRSSHDSTNMTVWGIKERFVVKLFNMVVTINRAFDDIDKLITTPLPLPFASLCKTLVMFYVALFPVSLDYTIGWFGGIAVPVVIAFVLLSIDAISTELENPFGDDPNDLDIDEMIHNLELEAMEMLRLCGDERCCHRFLWRKTPRFVFERSIRPISKQLVFADSAADEVVLNGVGNPAEDNFVGQGGTATPQTSEGSLIRASSES